MAKVIEQLQRPALVLAPNKILAAQLYGEFKSFFPNNAVEYFVSYYDYYQPEAYVPRSDTYIEKESSVNEAIDRMRHSATRALLERDDVIIVASVSLPLRHRLGRDLFGDDLRHQEGRNGRPARDHPQARRAAVQAQRRRLPARLLPGARRQPGDLPQPLRGHGLAGQLLRRRDRGDQRVRPADRHEGREPRQGPRLRQQPLRHPRPDDEAGDARRSGSSWPNGSRNCMPKAGCSKPSGSSSGPTSTSR